MKLSEANHTMLEIYEDMCTAPYQMTRYIMNEDGLIVGIITTAPEGLQLPESANNSKPIDMDEVAAAMAKRLRTHTI